MGTSRTKNVPHCHPFSYDSTRERDAGPAYVLDLPSLVHKRHETLSQTSKSISQPSQIKSAHQRLRTRLMAGEASTPQAKLSADCDPESARRRGIMALEQ